jgi:group II intron reverse transcriptase/maturase
MEKRGQQNNALNHGSTAVLWDREQLNKNRWLRIDSNAMDKEFKFNNLLQMINVNSLHEAYKALDGSKAIGVDGINKATYGKNLEANLENLADRIHSNSYKPQSKREVLIPKANGKKRPIAISCFEDKIVEAVLGKILNSLYEPIFIRNSFGFRPNKSAHNAVEAIYYSLKDNRRPFVVEIDFANFFNSISHEILLKLLGKRIEDKRLLKLIERFLKVGFLEQSGNTAITMVGTPQGSIMSPILANVYLHYCLDTWFIEKYASYSNIIVRYADDAVFLFSKQETAERFMEDLEERVLSYTLSLNMDKTEVVDMHKNKNKDFTFLGFTFYWGRKFSLTQKVLKVKTHKKTLHKKIQEFQAWIKQIRNKVKTTKIMGIIKVKLIGHYNYFGYVYNIAKLNHFYKEILKLTYKWLNRRSQKRSFCWRKLQVLPKPPVMTNLKSLGWCPYV